MLMLLTFSKYVLTLQKPSLVKYIYVHHQNDWKYERFTVQKHMGESLESR